MVFPLVKQVFVVALFKRYINDETREATEMQGTVTQEPKILVDSHALISFKTHESSQFMRVDYDSEYSTQTHPAASRSERYVSSQRRGAAHPLDTQFSL